LDRPDLVVGAAFRDVADKIAEAVGLPVWQGRLAVCEA
jgi:hypothetical protein